MAGTLAARTSDNRAIRAAQAKWCLDRRIDGWSVRRISAESEAALGVHLPPSTVYKRYSKEVDKLPRESAERLRAVELDRLDDLETRMREIASSEDNSESLRMAATDRLLKIQERRSKLTGIDAPERVAATTTVRYEVVGVEIAALT